ncbi:MAG: M28 family peptidase [Oscillatoriales cyanobacterium]|nr:MAG: M28 family peptidase [Oscillatoriales cyanobacterium]
MHEQLFETIRDLVMCHSPSGAEQEVDRWLIDRAQTMGLDWSQDEAGNLIFCIPGHDRQAKPIAITAHKDEIGAIVKGIETDGRVQLRKLGGSFPWVYGEGAIDLLGDRMTVTGILSFGSRHVSHESPQKNLQETQPLTWERAWVETGQSIGNLAAAGIRPGTRAVISKHRKEPIRLGPSKIASYTLDNKASVAILLDLAGRLQESEPPAQDVYLVASAKEEVGALGAMFFTQQHRLAALIALEIAPIAPEYPIAMGPTPVLLAQDAYGIYDDDLNRSLQAAADRLNLDVQFAAISGFGSDGSIAMKFGHVPRAACLAFPTQNTHGYEIAHLGAIARCTDILAEFLREQT